MLFQLTANQVSPLPITLQHISLFRYLYTHSSEEFHTYSKPKKRIFFCLLFNISFCFLFLTSLLLMVTYFQLPNVQTFYLKKRNAVSSTFLFSSTTAADRNRTGTGITTHGILSPGRLPVPPLRRMDGGGFEPPKQFAADLQSVPFGHSGIHPYLVKAFTRSDKIEL